MNKLRISIILFLFPFVLFSSAFYSQGQTNNDQQKKLKRFQLEVYGGIMFVNPHDLNLRSSYDFQYVDFQREFYKKYYPSIAQEAMRGEFKDLKSIIPFGMTFKLNLNRSFSLSLGVKYFSKDQISRVTSRFQNTNPPSVYFNYQFLPYIINARGVVPQLGIHYYLKRNNVYDIEFFVSGGPLLAEINYNIGIKRFSSQSDNIYNSIETYYEIEGKSTGISFNAGSKLSKSIKGPIKLFCEFGYSYQIAKNLKGKGKIEFYKNSSENGKEKIDEMNWEGYWGIKEILPYNPLPSNEWEKNDSRVGEFKLNLSGGFLNIGFSVGF